MERFDENDDNFKDGKLNIWEEIILKVGHIKLNNLEDITLFKNIGDLYIETNDAGDYEEEFDMLIQKIDSNPVLFGYLQYIELVFKELVSVIGIDGIKKWCDTLFNHDFNKNEIVSVNFLMRFNLGASLVSHNRIIYTIRTIIEKDGLNG